MWRYLAGGGAALALVGAGALVIGNRGTAVAPLQAQTGAAGGTATAEPLPDTAPEATAKTREQKRFGRYDKDRDGAITRDEYLAARRKAYARLDTNADGTLSFDEWAIKATTKFATADTDKSGRMNPAEFATTAVKRKPARVANCPPTPAPVEES